MSICVMFSNYSEKLIKSLQIGLTKFENINKISRIKIIEKVLVFY